MLPACHWKVIFVAKISANGLGNIGQAEGLLRVAQVSGFRFQVSGFRFQVSGFRFQVSGFRFQVSGFRFQVSGFRPCVPLC
jgi:hypothetical protein